MNSAAATWAPWAQRREALERIDAQIAAGSESLDLRFERACLLAELGESATARRAYLEILARSPSHLGALNNFGTLLCSTGYRTAARTAYMEAVRRHPNHPMALVNLANLFLESGDLDRAREHYQSALALDPNFEPAHQGLGSLYAELGEEESAAQHHRAGGWDRRATKLPYRGDSRPISILLLASGRRGDIPIRHLLDDKIFQTSVVLPSVFDAERRLPEHDLVFNSIGDADLCRQALDRAVHLADRTLARTINSPAAVLRTGRVENIRRLGDLPGVIAPNIAGFDRQLLSASDARDTLRAHGFDFPLLLRAPGFHNGRYFVLVESADDLRAAVAELPGDRLTTIQFLDARGPGGKFRKYRVMMIGGELYPLHLAISSQWKIHYVTSEMSESPEFRAEEVAFLENMGTLLGPHAMRALKHIQSTLALDYAGIDFGLSRDRKVLLFEANATMTVLPPPGDSRWDYRRAAVERIESAVRRMIIENSEPSR